MKQLLIPVAFGLLFPTAALAQVDAEVAAQFKDTRDLYGCVRGFTAPPQTRADLGPLGEAMGQMAAGLISGPSFRSLPANVPPCVIPMGLVEGILHEVFAEPTQNAITYGSSRETDRSGWWLRVWFCDHSPACARA